MEASNHIKIKWTIRGDYQRPASEAWEEGAEVRLPNYTYGSARYDSSTNTVLLSNGGSITTVINYYKHMEMIPLEEVECIRCGKPFSGRRTCPSCGSGLWEIK